MGSVTGQAARGAVTEHTSAKLVCDALHRASPDPKRLGHLQDTDTVRKPLSHLPLGRAIYLRPAEPLREIGGGGRAGSHQLARGEFQIAGKRVIRQRIKAGHDDEPGGPDREYDAVATVLIIGASRGIGLETVRAALEAGHSVRALARSARRIRLYHPKLEKMAGDALGMATVKRALTGVDVVVQSLGVAAELEAILKPTRFFSKATRVLITAMEEAQVKRLICVTGFGAGDSRGRGGFLFSVAFHLLLGRVYDDKDVQERIVRNSKLDWMIVRPVILTDGPKTNAHRALVDPRGWTCGFISRADVADFLVKQIDDDAFLYKTPLLTS